MTSRAIRHAIHTAVAACLSLTACAPESAASRPRPRVEVFEPIVLTPAAVLLDETGVQVLEVRPDAVVVARDEASAIYLGAVIAGTDPRGGTFLRHVTGLSASGSDRVEARTEPAALTHLVMSGHLVVHVEDVDAERGVTEAALADPFVGFAGISCSGASPPERDGLRAFLEPTVRVGDLELDISAAGVAECTLAVGSTLAQVLGADCHGVIDRFGIDVDATLYGGVRWTAVRERRLECEVDPLGVLWPSIPLGGVPVLPGVVITLHLRPIVASGFELRERFAAELELGASARMVGRLSYERGVGWHHTFGRPTTELRRRGDLTAALEGRAWVDVGVQFAARVDALAGPYVELTQGAGASWTVDLLECSQTFAASLRSRYEFGASFEAFGADLGVELDELTFEHARIASTSRLPICGPGPTDAGSRADGGSPWIGGDAGVAGGDAGAPVTDASMPHDAGRECTASRTEPCGRCGTRTTPCIAGRWGTASACAGEGACAAGTTMVCAGSGATVTCNGACAWPACPAYCGDGFCSGADDCVSCPADCGCTPGVCDPGIRACVACGAASQPCCAGGACTGGASLECRAGTCRHCGASGEPCCSAGTACSAGLVCNTTSTTCQPVSAGPLWIADFEGISFGAANGGRVLPNGIEVVDNGAAPYLRTEIGPGNPGQALAITGAGRYSPHLEAQLTLPPAVDPARNAILTFEAYLLADAPGDIQVYVQRGTCGPPRAYTIRRGAWRSIPVDLPACSGSGVVMYIGEAYELATSAPSLWIDNIRIDYR